MSYTALYRKFRPAVFEDVKGQDHIVTTLKNQIRSDKIQHAYLFTGTRGTGKTSVAKLFAKAINCENPDGQNPCMHCASCQAIQSGASMNVVEIDAASNNGVDNIREIIDEVSYPPTQGRFKVYIIDEVHMLSAGAFNALLKTLEEPPSYVVFILATTEVHKIPITILSRCQRYDFRRISVDDILLRINELLPEEGIEADEDALRYVARAGDGSLRDSLSLLDQCIAFNFGKKLEYEMVLDTLGAVNSTIFSDMLRMIIVSDVAGSIRQLEQVIIEGRELSQFVLDFTWYVRNILLAITSDDISAVVDMSKENLARLMDEAKQVRVDQAMRYIRILSDLSNQIRFAANKRVLVELAIIKMCKPEMEIKDDALLARIHNVEDVLANGIAISPNESSVPTATEKTESEPMPNREDVPVDVKTVVENWSRIVNAFPYPDKSFVKNTVPSLGANGELVIVFPSESAMGFFTDGENERGTIKTAQLKQTIEDVSGAKVEIRLELKHRNSEGMVREPADLRSLFASKGFGDITVVEEE